MSRGKAVYICGGYTQHLDPRDPCPNALHDWPLPKGYVEAIDVVESRMAAGWTNIPCPDCDHYGWTFGAEPEVPTTRVPAPGVES